MPRLEIGCRFGTRPTVSATRPDTTAAPLRQQPETNEVIAFGKTEAQRMPRSTICEARYRRGAWEIMPVDQAVVLSTRVEKRCVECHGRVRAHRSGDWGAAHFEHIQSHKGCSLDDCYDGNGPRFHPVAVI
jgi:hypothetical protein